MNLLHEIAHSIFSWIVKVTMYDAKINLYNLDVLILSFFCHKYLIPSSSTRNSLKQTLRIGILLVLLSTDIQSRTLNFATSAGAMNRFAPTKVAKFKVRDCTRSFVI